MSVEMLFRFVALGCRMLAPSVVALFTSVENTLFRLWHIHFDNARTCTVQWYNMWNPGTQPCVYDD